MSMGNELGAMRSSSSSSSGQKNLAIARGQENEVGKVEERQVSINTTQLGTACVELSLSSIPRGNLIRPKFQHSTKKRGRGQKPARQRGSSKERNPCMT